MPYVLITRTDNGYDITRNRSEKGEKNKTLLTSAGLLIPLISHFASPEALSFSDTFSITTSLFSLVLMVEGVCWARCLRVRLQNGGKRYRAVACVTRNETPCPRAASVSGEMPERAASSGENPRGRGGRDRERERGERRVRQSRTSQEWRVSCTDDCGANSAKLTTTRSRFAPSTSNLALFKNEDGAGLKLDKCLIG